MKLFTRFMIAFVPLALIAVLPAAAQRPQKVVSGRGVGILGCSPTSSGLPCFQVIPTSAGANTATFININFDGTAATDSGIELFKVPTTQSVTFNSLAIGSFMCGDGILPSDPAIGGFCTDTPDPGALASTYVTPVAGSGGLLTFNFNPSATDIPAEWVFFADLGASASIVPGGTTTGVPEPSSILLASCGLLGLLGIKRLRLPS